VHGRFDSLALVGTVRRDGGSAGGLRQRSAAYGGHPDTTYGL